MFQNKKLKRNATYAIAEVAEVALVILINCALPTSEFAVDHIVISCSDGSSQLRVRQRIDESTPAAGNCACSLALLRQCN